MHRGFHNKEMLIKELDRLGVNYDVRRLQVGDFLWVAQHVSGADLTAFFGDCIFSLTERDIMFENLHLNNKTQQFVINGEE